MMLDQGLEKSPKGFVHFAGEREGEGLPNQEEENHHQPHSFLCEHKEVKKTTLSMSLTLPIQSNACFCWLLCYKLGRREEVALLYRPLPSSSPPPLMS